MKKLNEECYYWVQLPKSDYWEIAFYNGGRFYRAGLANWYVPDFFETIGECIPSNDTLYEAKEIISPTK